MIDESEIKLQQEAQLGAEHQRTWSAMVEPFYNQRQDELFEAFRACTPGDTERATQILHQSKSLDSMRNHFLHFIQTGQMATQSLEKTKG